jgi:hypothetical protein
MNSRLRGNLLLLLTALSTTTKEFKLRSCNLCNKMALTIVSLPITVVDRALNIYLTSLANILIYNISKATPEDNGMPLCLLRGLISLTVEETLCSSNTQTSRFNTTFKASNLRVGTNITDKNNFVYHYYNCLINSTNNLLIRSPASRPWSCTSS